MAPLYSADQSDHSMSCSHGYSPHSYSLLWSYVIDIHDLNMLK